MLENMSIKVRIIALAATIGIAFSMVTAWGLSRFKADLELAHYQKPEIAVDIASATVSHFAKEAKEGRMTVAEAQARALESIKQFRYNGKEYVWINDMAPTMVMHPIKPELNGKDLSTMADPNGKKLFLAFVDTCRKSGSGFVDYMWPKPGSEKPVPKISFVRLYPEWNWIIGSGVYLDEVSAKVAKTLWSAGLAVFAIFVVCISISIFLARRLAGPLRAAIETLTDETARMNNVSQSIFSVAGEFSQGAHDQADSVKNTVGTMNSISTMTKQSSENSESARQLAEGAFEEVEKANQSMTSMVTQMEELRRIGEEISNIIKTIDEIAFQTNLLALNAAVEAARAGQAGAGFAVVANEVRTLAGRAAGAAKDTTALIQNTHDKIAEGTRLVGRTNDDFQKVATAVKKVRELVTEISSATQEQNKGILEIGTGLEKIGSISDTNATHATQIANTSQALKSDNDSLKEIVSQIRLLVEGSRTREK